jgi:hypothetical protein
MLGPSVLAALAQVFGERRLEITLWDPSDEMLEVMDRLGRHLFALAENDPALRATTDTVEALDASQKVIWCGGAGFEHLLAEKEIVVLKGVEEPNASHWRINWPPEPTPKEVKARPLQLLRWLNEEDYPWDLLKQCANSPLASWLDNPLSAPYSPEMLREDGLT